MSKNHTIRNLVPQKLPDKLMRSKDYSNIILYALEVFGPMVQQEFVNRGTIIDKIPEKTFYNHIKQLKKKGDIESEIDEETRRRTYIITTSGEKALKTNLGNKKEEYGDVLSKIENVKYYEKKKIFDKHFERYLELCNRVGKRFLTNIADISHFYPEDKFVNYDSLKIKLNNEQILKNKMFKKFNSFIQYLKEYKEHIEKDLLDGESEIFYNEEIENYDFHCPRCKGKKNIDYGKIFECTNCGLEFEKISFKLIDREDTILANEEKKEIIDIFKDSSNEDELNTI